MAKMELIVCVDPTAMRLRQLQKTTTNHTALTGVVVKLLTLLHTLYISSSVDLSSDSGDSKERCSYLESGRASSRANAYAMRAFASRAEHPVKNWTRMTKKNIIEPPVFPPAFRNI